MKTRIYATPAVKGLNDEKIFNHFIGYITHFPHLRQIRLRWVIRWLASRIRRRRCCLLYWRWICSAGYRYLVGWPGPCGRWYQLCCNPRWNRHSLRNIWHANGVYLSAIWENTALAQDESPFSDNEYSNHYWFQSYRNPANIKHMYNICTTYKYWPPILREFFFIIFISLLIPTVSLLKYWPPIFRHKYNYNSYIINDSGCIIIPEGIAILWEKYDVQTVFIWVRYGKIQHSSNE